MLRKVYGFLVGLGVLAFIGGIVAMFAGIWNVNTLQGEKLLATGMLAVLVSLIFIAGGFFGLMVDE